ncbi:MAG: hypothetical protein C0621_08675 [Desulfuromonas sp.]|nr:MAG: hypothetical protein C0621_08675 [Desulfuromonas sp.]
MHAVILNNDQSFPQERLQELAALLQLTLFDLRQRLYTTGPVVVARFAAEEMARERLQALLTAGFSGFAIDSSALDDIPCLLPRSLCFTPEELTLSLQNDEQLNLPYLQLDALIVATRSIGQNQFITTTQRSFSLGKTLMAGGIPMTKKKVTKEQVAEEGQERVLYLASGEKRLLFREQGMSYEGLGEDMKPTREQNFTTLLSRLRRRAPNAAYDERLLTKAMLNRLLGPLPNPQEHLRLAAEILVRSLTP